MLAWILFGVELGAVVALGARYLIIDPLFAIGIEAVASVAR